MDKLCRPGDDAADSALIVAMPPDRPPAYVSRSTLARELDMSESTVDEMVRRGVLPRPLRLSSGCVRWRWATVELALDSLSLRMEAPPQEDPLILGARRATQAALAEDPFIAGARRAGQIAREQREARAKNRKPK